MDITELNEGALLIVKSAYYDHVEEDDSSVSFETRCVTVLKHGIMVDEIHDEGSPISFRSEKVKNDLYWIDEGKPPIVWEDVSIFRVKRKGESFHAIAQKRVGYKLNRRNSFRVPVGNRGVARLGVSRKTANVVVKDVSCSGFAIIVEPEHIIEMGDSIRVVYDDIGLNVALNGFCVRKEKLRDGRNVYGCVLDAFYGEIREYVNRKQQEIVARKKSKEDGIYN